MLRNSLENHQTNIFGEDLLQQLDRNEPLFQLSKRIPWKEFHDEFKSHYKKSSAPAKPIRLMIGLLILKQLHDLSVVVAWKKNRIISHFAE